jgi:AcrR family transcriptional regulator
MIAAQQGLPVSGQETQERGDAARNRELLLAAARKLIAERGPDAVTMDDIAVEAGVGKGTLFRRFGNRSGLMLVLLDEDEQALQRAFLFGPPPLGPGAPPLDRLLAYGRARLKFVGRHRSLLRDAGRDPQVRYNAPYAVQHTHLRVLLEAAGTKGNVHVQADALLMLLDADYVTHQLQNQGLSLDALGDAWENVARKLCGQ